MIAVLDIGSNSVRMMLWNNGVTQSKITVTTRLSEGILLNGFLLPQAINRTVDAICDLIKQGKSLGATNFYLFATEAVRRATNKTEFINAVYNKCGLTVEVVSGDTEALLGIYGALERKDGGIIDVGGASTEISISKNGKLIYSKSVPMGSVIVKEKCAQNKQKATEYINSMIDLYQTVPFTSNMISLGGTATTLASVLLELEPYNPELVHGYKITKQSVLNLVNKLYALSIEERKKLKGLHPQRADVISGGALILYLIMQRFGYEYITVSESDNLEGYCRLKILGEKYE